MGRPKRDLKVLNMNIPTSLINEVEEYASDNGMNKTDSICKLLKIALRTESKAREKETV